MLLQSYSPLWQFVRVALLKSITMYHQCNSFACNLVYRGTAALCDYKRSRVSLIKIFTHGHPFIYHISHLVSVFNSLTTIIPFLSLSSCSEIFPGNILTLFHPVSELVCALNPPVVYSTDHSKAVVPIQKLMAKAYPDIGSTVTFNQMTIHHLLQGLPDQTIAYEVLIKKPRCLKDAVDMITWHECCKETTRKKSGLRQLSSYV